MTMDSLMEKLYKLQAQILCVTEGLQSVKHLHRDDVDLCNSTVDALLSDVFNLKEILAKYSPSDEQVDVKIELDLVDDVISGTHPLDLDVTTDGDSDFGDGFMDEEPEPLIKSEKSPQAGATQTDEQKETISFCQLLIKRDVCGACGENFSEDAHNCNCNGSNPVATKGSAKPKKKPKQTPKERKEKKPRGRPKKPNTNSNNTKESYSCELCGIILKTPRGLKYHQSKHTGLYRFKCPVCDKGFNRKACYKVHLNAHEGIKMFVCERCGKALTHSNSLSQHKKYCHVAEADREKFSCDLCDKFYYRRKSLQDHIEQIHENKYLHQCDNCGEMTTSRKSRELHGGGKCKAAKNKLEIDLDNLPDDGKLRCRLCGKAFTRKDSLREHIESVHDKKRKHSCEACGKLFKSRAAKSNHKKKLYCKVLRGSTVPLGRPRLEAIPEKSSCIEPTPQCTEAIQLTEPGLPSSPQQQVALQSVVLMPGFL